jgi:hypothetical protein
MTDNWSKMFEAELSTERSRSTAKKRGKNMGNHPSMKTPPELVVAVCVLGATTAYLLAQAQGREACVLRCFGSSRSTR